MSTEERETLRLALAGESSRERVFQEDGKQLGVSEECQRFGIVAIKYRGETRLREVQRGGQRFSTMNTL